MLEKGNAAGVLQKKIKMSQTNRWKTRSIRAFGLNNNNNNVKQLGNKANEKVVQLLIPGKTKSLIRKKI